MTTIPRIISADDHVVEPPDVFTGEPGFSAPPLAVAGLLP